MQKRYKNSLMKKKSKDESYQVLGVESSCDDTAASVVKITNCTDNKKIEVLSSIVLNQNSLHSEFKGVVPEIAARAHSERIDICTKEALKKANISVKDIDLICVTSGPGLIGGLLSGVMFAKGLAKGLNKPIVGVNHLAAHCFSVKMLHKLECPYLTLLVSGGHCQFLIVKGVDNFYRLGGTIDDAPGECFDKIASFLGIGYPGGPIIETRSKKGNEERFDFPKPIYDSTFNMSFSGLKTAVKRETENLIKKQGGLYQKDINDICASFQKTATEIFKLKTTNAIKFFYEKYQNHKSFAVVGGVAANEKIRTELEQIANENSFNFFTVPAKYCTDNAAMIAFLGFEKYVSSNFNITDLTVKPRWPLDKISKPILGFGKRGAKA